MKKNIYIMIVGFIASLTTPTAVAKKILFQNGTNITLHAFPIEKNTDKVKIIGTIPPYSIGIEFGISSGIAAIGVTDDYTIKTLIPDLMMRCGKSGKKNCLSYALYKANRTKNGGPNTGRLKILNANQPWVAFYPVAQKKQGQSPFFTDSNTMENIRFARKIQ